MAAKGARVHVYGDWDGSAVKRAQGDLGKFGKDVDGFSKSVKGSFLGIGAAIGAAFSLSAVVNFMKGASQAALEDERSMVALAKAMENVGLAAQNANVEAFVEDLMLARGVADDQLRPALQTIITATGNAAESQKALSLALDISAGTGRDLQSVSQALARAYTGQTTALQRLGVGIDSATLKSKDMDLISAQLSDRFQGQSAAAAETYEGRLRRVNMAADEARETIGYALLKALDNVSKSMGGTDGAVETITVMGERLGLFIEGLSLATQSMDGFTVSATDQSDEVDRLARIYSNAGGGLRGFVSVIRNMEFDSTISPFEVMAVAARNAERAVDAYAQRLIAQAKAAREAEAAQRALNSAMNAGIQQVDSGWVASFYGVNPSAQRAMAEARVNTRQIVEDYQELQREQTNVGSSATRTAEVVRIKWKEIADSVDGAVIRISGKATEVSGKLADTFKERTGLFREVVNEQVAIIQDAQQALDDYANKVTDAIMGKLDFSQTDAEGKPLTPEQIVSTLIGDIANQQAAVTRIAESGIMTQLPMALAEKILALPPDAAVALANYFSANPTQLETLTNNYNALATFTETALGVPMARTFAVIGDESAVTMIAKAQSTIAEQARAFKRFVQEKLSTTITVGVRYEAINSLPGVGGGTISVPVERRANGGPLFSGLPTLVGERGPEIIVPTVAGTVIRGEQTRQMLRSGGGDVYLTVNAGMGTNGPEVGRQIVEALKQYERRNGPVYASA